MRRALFLAPLLFAASACSDEAAPAVDAGPSPSDAAPARDDASAALEDAAAALEDAAATLEDAGTPTVAPALAVFVVTPNGEPIARVAVEVGLERAETDEGGVARFAGLPAGEHVVRARSLTHTPAAIKVQVTPGLPLERSLTVLPVRSLTSFDVATGVEVEVGFAKVSIPPSAVRDARGAAVTGMVELAVTPIDPSSAHERLASPGPLVGRMPGESADVELDSFGMVEVELRRAAEVLALDPSRPATLRFVVPSSARGLEPDGATVPAWSYDLASAEWRPEGAGRLSSASFTGPDGASFMRQVWTATVAHFSPWNADRVRGTPSCALVRVVDEELRPVRADVGGQPNDAAGYSCLSGSAGGSLSFMTLAEGYDAPMHAVRLPEPPARYCSGPHAGPSCAPLTVVARSRERCVRGRAVDATGAPLAGVRLTARVFDASSGNPMNLVVWGESDASGGFCLNTLRDTYLLIHGRLRSGATTLFGQTSSGVPTEGARCGSPRCLATRDLVMKPAPKLGAVRGRALASFRRGELDRRAWATPTTPVFVFANDRSFAPQPCAQECQVQAYGDLLASDTVEVFGEFCVEGIPLSERPEQDPTPIAVVPGDCRVWSAPTVRTAEVNREGSCARGAVELGEVAYQQKPVDFTIPRVVLGQGLMRSGLPLVEGRAFAIGPVITGQGGAVAGCGEGWPGLTVKMSRQRSGGTLNRTLDAKLSDASNTCGVGDPMVSIGSATPGETFVFTVDADDEIIEEVDGNNARSVQPTVAPAATRTLSLGAVDIGGPTLALEPDNPWLASVVRRLLPVALTITPRPMAMVSLGAKSCVADESAAWTQLVDDLCVARMAEGSMDIYYGIVPVPDPSCADITGVARRPGNIGAIWDGVDLGASGQSRNAALTLAHELGHSFCLGHAPGGPANPDPAYPVASGHLDACGYDAEGGGLMDKAARYDLMSYLLPRWISRHHSDLVASFLGGARAADCPTSPADCGSGVPYPSRDPARSLLVVGRIGPEGQVELRPIHRVARAPLPREPGPYSLRLHGEGGVRELRFGTTRAALDDAGVELESFGFLVEDPGALSRIEILKDGATLLERRAAEHALDPGLRVASKDGRLVVDWAADRYPSMLALYLHADGRVSTLSPGLGGGHVELPLAGATPNGVLRLDLSDGVRSIERTIAAPR